MKEVFLNRDPSDDQGTSGVVTTPSGLRLYSGELPDRGNIPDKSCVNKGSYVCKHLPSPRHGWCYYLLDVEGRMNVEIHIGNFFGNVDNGYKSDVLGCIILGRAIGEIDNQRAILSSRDAVQAFEADMEKKDFLLTIR